MLALIAEARRCLDEVQAFGTAEARSVVIELGGVMQTMALTAEVAMSEEDRKQFLLLGNALVQGVVASGIWTGLELGATHVAKMLGS
jgi:hypothetical protein